MPLKNILRTTSLVEILGTISLTISCLSLVCFAWLSWLVLEEKLTEFDQSLLQSLHQILPASFIHVAKPIYFIGEAEVAVFFVLLSLGILCWQRLWLEAQVVATASLTALLLVDQVFKPIFDRSRPLGRLVDNIHGRSFPSGHATGNLLLYFLLVYIASIWFPQHKIKLYAIAIILLLLMGLGSTYLRVHWATDILAGYCLGYLLFALSIIFLRISDKKYRNH